MIANDVGHASFTGFVIMTSAEALIAAVDAASMIDMNVFIGCIIM